MLHDLFLGLELHRWLEKVQAIVVVCPNNQVLIKLIMRWLMIE